MSGLTIQSISTLPAPLHISPLSLFLLALNWADDPRQEIEYVVGKVIACSVAMSCKSFLCVHVTTVTCLEAENE